MLNQRLIIERLNFIKGLKTVWSRVLPVFLTQQKSFHRTYLPISGSIDTLPVYFTISYFNNLENFILEATVELNDHLIGPQPDLYFEIRKNLGLHQNQKTWKNKPSAFKIGFWR